jgi:aromatic ring hydroxylase
MQNFPTKRIPAASKTQARSIIQNHLNFLTMLFEQSKDPYYNVPKWTDECLEENKIGTITETESQLQAVSLLYLSRSHEVGHCGRTPGAYQAYVVYIYCEKGNEVLEVKYPVENQKAPGQINLCE